MRTTNTHIFFWGGEFSNWHPCKFSHKHIEFDNTEQTFMWEKALHFRDTKIANQILRTSDPKECKRLGKLVKGFDVEQWMINSFTIMVGANYNKYTQNEDLKQILLSTGDKTIVEASPYDKIWGIGLGLDNDDCLDETKWQGMNLLGKALMHVRKIIKEENEKNN